jgi:predicted RNA-binding Zn-ribbon protein involved in translation (DUF1610 family)
MKRRPREVERLPGRRASWRRRLGPQILVCAVLLGVGVLLGDLADARPGGGHSYSGGSSSYSSGSYSGGSSSYSSGSYSGGSSSYSSGSYSSGGSYSGGGTSGCELISLLFFGFIGLMSTVLKAMADGGDSFDSHYDNFEPPPEPILQYRTIDWNALWVRDPEFSPVVFQDFVYQLYARVHEARNDPEAMASLAPYVVTGAREALARRDPTDAKITQVVIGSMQVISLKTGDAETTIEVRFESNVTAEHPNGERSSDYLVEQWRLIRAASVRSKPPEQALALKCPNCGAPFESTDDQRCDYCGEIVDNGRFDWFVNRTSLRQSEQRPPALGGYAPEVGTDRPTLVSPSFAKRWRDLLADDPKLAQADLEARIRTIFDRLNTAWVARNLDSARPYLSEGIHDYLRYWIDAYERQGLINCLENTTIERIELCKLVRDNYYDALTVRVFASGLDYTIRELDEQRVGGSATKPRRYSEYWTLIRGAGVRGEAHSDFGCPNCGAPLTVNMAGNCEHCSAHLTRGEFDWVLSRIEQDESYRG